MADSTSNVAALNNLLPDYYVPKMLMRLEAETPLLEFAVKTPLPMNEGRQVFWNGWRTLAGASALITEGTTGNDSVSLSSRRVSATIVQTGRSVRITDLAKMVLAFSAVEGAQETLKDSARKTVEHVLHMGIYKNNIANNRSTTGLLSSKMSAVASAFCLNTGTISDTFQFQFPAVFGTTATRLSAVNAAAPSTSAQLSIYAIRKATQRLRRFDVMPLADGFYVGYTHPNAIHTLKKDPTWTQWNAYQNSKETMYTGEAGKVDQVRFVMSTLAPRFAVAAHSVNGVFIFGKEAFGITELDGGLKQIVAGGPDTSNRYDTFGYISYKYTGIAAALNPSAGVILWVHERI